VDARDPGQLAVSHSTNGYRKEERGTIEEVVASAGIPFIDTTAAFKARLDPSSLFVLHLTTEGYRVVADYVVQQLQRLEPPR
jgi:hypothetical protein